MLNPQDFTPGSIMPPYPWLFDCQIDEASTPGKIRAMASLGVPYPKDYDAVANEDLNKQANEIAARLKKDNITIAPNTEIVAIIAYLQRLGKDIKAENEKQLQAKETTSKSGN
jgi:cytochrome c oxidase cbb3-type subunit I/II